MGQDVLREIDALATANSDSTQWSLAQADVELLSLKWAIAAAGTGGDDALGDVRTRFDILYSRIRTISTSPLYSGLRADPVVTASLDRINRYLSDSIPLIDGSDAALRAGLTGLAERTEAVRADVRRVTLQGVAVLARQADMQRSGIAETLTLVSVLTLVLFLTLLILLGILIVFVRREQQRAREHGLVRARLASIIGTSLDAVLVVDPQGRIVEFNGAAEEIFGYARDEALGAAMEDLIIPDHLKQAHRDGMQRYLETGVRHVIGKGRIQMEARCKDGSHFPVELSVSSADSEHGELFVSFARDISRRVAAERELIKARDEAVAGERAKADLIAVMSHEMRTPLNGMLGTLELLDTEGRSAKDRDYLGLIRASGQQLLHHVDNVLEISRAEAGKIKSERDVFSLRALVRELVEGQRGAAENRGNAITYRVETRGRDHAIGDPARLRQVLLNLIGNAIKFTRNGAIALEVDRLGNGDLVEFRVIDTGIGIDPADQARVFDDFVTLDTSYSRVAGGTGLGLAIVKRIVEAMGGEVGLESARGEGSLFWVRLPLPAAQGAPRPGKPEKRETGAAPSPVAPLRVLIVEDNRINRIVLRDLLEQDGHHVDEAHDGQQAVERVRRTSYDLVFMDISMPVMDGVEATRAIRDSEARGTRLPLIALTAHARPTDKERFRAAGLDDILVKPITRDGLRAIIARFSQPDRSAGALERPAFQQGATLVDRAHLDSLTKALGHARVADLISQYRTEMEGAVTHISDALDSGAVDAALAEKVHHAAGSSAMVGAMTLRDALARLEDRITRGDAASPEEAAALQRIWARTRDALPPHGV